MNRRTLFSRLLGAVAAPVVAKLLGNGLISVSSQSRLALLTRDMVSEHTLQVLAMKTVMCRELNQSGFHSGRKIGKTLTIRRPPRYSV